MNRNLLKGVLIVVGIAVTVFNPPISGILALGVWIYLARMVRTHKKSVLNERMEPRIGEMHLKKLKALLIAAGSAFLIFIVAAIVHNAVHDLSETEETASLLIALVALWVFVAATACGMVIFLKERQDRPTRV